MPRILAVAASCAACSSIDAARSAPVPGAFTCAVAARRSAITGSAATALMSAAMRSRAASLMPLERDAIRPTRPSKLSCGKPSSETVGTSRPGTRERLVIASNSLSKFTPTDGGTARVTNTVVTLAVPPSLGVNSPKEFVALARQQPGKLNFASVTTVTDIIMAGYFKSAGLDVQKVSYKDTVTALNDLMEGRIQMYGAAYAIVRSQAQAGRVKVLAITNRSRVPGLDVPTVSELGFPQLNFDGLVGLIASRSSGISDAARERIAADIKAVAADPVIAERLAATAQVNAPGTGADLAASIEEQAAQLAATAKILGMKPNF